MRTKPVLPVVVAVAGLAGIVVGIYQGLVHVAPGYGGTISSGWGGTLNHEERLLASIAAVGIGGTVASLRWKRFCAVPVAAGGVVLFYALRAILQYVQTVPLYAETTTRSGEPVVFILGAEPFLLILGGVLLVGAGLLGWRQQTNRDDERTPSIASSSQA